MDKRYVILIHKVELCRCVTMALKDLKLRAIFDGDLQDFDADDLDAQGEISGKWIENDSVKPHGYCILLMS
jgi:hypothetical protein